MRPENKSVADTIAQTVSKWALKLGVSGVLGYCSGLFIRRTLKTAAYYIGGFFLALQILVYKNWMNVNWDQITRDFTEGLDPTSKDSMLRKFLYIMLYRIP